MKKLLPLGAALVAVLSLTQTAAAQQDLVLEAPRDVRRAPPSLVDLDSAEVPQELRGLVCAARVVGVNNPSTHEGNDLLLVSASTETFSNVETIPDDIADDEGTITLGETIKLQLRLGAGGVSSAGWQVSIDCPPPATTTTAPGSSTTTEPPGTTTPPPTLPPTPPETNPPVTVPDFTG